MGTKPILIVPGKFVYMDIAPDAAYLIIEETQKEIRGTDIRIFKIISVIKKGDHVKAIHGRNRLVSRKEALRRFEIWTQWSKDHKDIIVRL